MKPLPNFWLRGVILLVMLIPLFFASSSIYVKLFIVIWMAFLVGTAWRSDIVGTKLERQFILAFIPLRTKRWSLDKFQRIETDHKGHTSAWAAAAVGGVWFILWRICDWMFPWMGGAYQLYLRGKTAKRVLVWQGNLERDFDANTQRLIETTGFPVERR